MPLCVPSGAKAPGKLQLGSGAAEGGGDVVLRRAGVPGDGWLQEQAHRMGTWLGLSSATLRAAGLGAGQPFPQNPVTSVFWKDRRSLKQHPAGIRRCCGTSPVLEQHQKPLGH